MVWTKQATLQGPPGADSTVPGPQGPQGMQGIQGPQGNPGTPGATTFQALTDAADYSAGVAGQFVRVNAGGTGLDYVAPTSGAPTGAQYLTAATDATLTAERVATNTATVTWDFVTAAQAKVNLVVPVTVANGGSGASDAATARTNFGLGTMSTQNANTVAITGGSATGLSGLTANSNITRNNTPGDYQRGFVTDMMVAGGVDRTAISCFGDAPSYIAGPVTLASTLQVGSYAGFGIAPIGGWAIVTNGMINTTSATTNKAGGGPWGDSSSRRLKRDITPIRGALDLLLAQQGVEFTWDEPTRAAVLPGRQYGFVLEDVTVPQWHDGPGVDGEPVLTLRGYEALMLEALREVAERLDALEDSH
jgi:hypothetical protein